MFGECHGHIFMNGVNYLQAVKMYQTGINEADIRQKLAVYQQKGITYYRDGGDIFGASAYAREIAPEYGITYKTPVFAIHKNGHYGKIVGFGFDTMKEYQRLVLKAKEAKSDFIKVMFSGILDFDTDGGITGEALARDEIREMIHIAHEEGFAVMAHVNGARTIQNAVEAGVDSVEHGNFMDEECLLAMAESHAVWVPTFVTIYNLLGSGRFQDCVIQKLVEQQEPLMKRAFELKIPVALGSDAGAYRVLHGQGIIDEYHQMQRLLPEMDDLEQRLHEAEALIQERFKR